MAVNGINKPVTTSKLFHQAGTAKKQEAKATQQDQMPKYTGNICSQAYCNIHKLSPEQRFDVELSTGTKLKDGSTLIQPVILSLGEVSITPTEEGKYDIKSAISKKTLTMSEDELLSTKWLSRGTIKRNDDSSYTVKYIDRDDAKHTIQTTKKGAMQILVDNVYHI